MADSFKDDIKKRKNELEFPTDMYSISGSLTIPPLFNAPRKNIWHHNVSQLVNLIEPTFCHIYGGFEKIAGSYSEMFKKAKTDLEVIKIFKRNKFHYLVLVYDIETSEYNIIERREIEEFSEGYATQYNNEFLDSLKEGDIIEKGIPYLKSTSFDEHENYSLFKELNTLYMISTDTEEDCITLMNGAHKMMDNYRSETVLVGVSRNNAVINFYGDKKNFKGFPEVGEHCKDGILMATRDITNDSILYGGKDGHMSQLRESDLVKYGDGLVIDLTIYNNHNIDDLPDSKVYADIKRLTKEQNKFYYDLFEYLKELKYNSGNNYTCGPMINYWITRAKKFIDPSEYFKDNENVFGHVLMEFKLLERNQLLPGSKLSGQDGNKGTIGEIYKKSLSWKTQSGRPIHIICNMLGIIGRVNIGQIFKPMVNFISDEVRKQIIELDPSDSYYFDDVTGYLTASLVESMKDAKVLSERFELLREYFEILDTPDAEYVVEYFEKLPKNKQLKFMRNIMKNGIHVMQDPALPSTVEDLEKAVNRFGIEPEYIVMPDGSTALRKAIVAPAPWIRLKQDPIDKYAVRGRGPLNPINYLPSKSYSKKNHETPFADSAVKLGTYETLNLAIANSPAAISQFGAVLSSSMDAKTGMAVLYEEELDSNVLGEIIAHIHQGPRKNTEIIAAKQYQLGNRISITTKPKEDLFVGTGTRKFEFKKTEKNREFKKKIKE